MNFGAPPRLSEKIGPSLPANDATARSMIARSSARISPSSACTSASRRGKSSIGDHRVGERDRLRQVAEKGLQVEVGLGDRPRGHLHGRQVIDVGGRDDPGERIDLPSQRRFALEQRVRD